MLGPGEPFLAGEGFDWNSKTIYAIFDYEGMRDEQEWSVVWTRDGLEVSRQDDLSWDVGRDGSSGTRWVVYHNDGFYVFGGDYTVSLYIGDELQAEASFSVGFYPTPTPEQGRLFQP